jgi:hypothetical protein
MYCKPCVARLPALVIIPLVVGVICGCEDGDHGPIGAPEIDPVSVSISAATATNIVFTASGGAGDYRWEVSDPALGTIVVADTIAIYSSRAAGGQNFITVTDGNTNAITATVTQR